MGVEVPEADKKWAATFTATFHEGNSGCLRYTPIYIEINNAIVKGIATNVTVAIDGELETTEIKEGHHNTLFSEKHFNQEAWEVPRHTLIALLGTLRKVTTPTSSIIITGAPGSGARYAEVPGKFGSKILRDVFGAFFNSCGVPNAKIVITEETEKDDINIAW